MVVNSDADLGGLSEEHKSRVQLGWGHDWPRTGNVIATAAALSGADECDILIRADGGRDTRKRNNVIPIGSLLIDLDDHFHPALQRWSKERRLEYAEAGWLASEATQPATPLEKFLKTRPHLQASQ